MKRLCLLSIISLILHFSSFSQQCYPCKKEFAKLLRIRKQKVVDSVDLDKSLQITADLYDKRYIHYIDTVINRVIVSSHDISGTFTDICIKADGHMGVKYYLEYLQIEKRYNEQRGANNLERLFFKYPEIMLSSIKSNKELLNDLSWGFLYNRYYCEKNPLENNELSDLKSDINVNRRLLDVNYCKEIFFNTYPLLKEKYDMYKVEIDVIVNNAVENSKVNEFNNYIEQ